MKMNKLAAAFLSAATAASAVSYIPASAAEADYQLPTYSMTITNENIGEDKSSITLDADDFSDGSCTLHISVYVSDPDLKSWYVSPKIKASDKNISFENIFVPTGENHEFAYGQTKIINDTVKLLYSVSAGKDPDCNTMFFTCQTDGMTDRNPLVPLGETSDAYELTHFDAVIDDSISDGLYRIYFLTEPEDYSYQQVTSGVFRILENDSDITLSSAKTYYPNVKDITINIDKNGDDDFLYGDVNFDGKINPVDASLVLNNYTLVASGGTSALSDLALKAGDIDFDGKLSPTDATAILRFYTFVASSAEDVHDMPIHDYLNIK